jgi:hypothetical protein
MSDDIRRIQDDLQRQRQEIERSASLLKNTQPKLFSATDGTFKSPNKRFAFATPDYNIPPFSITSNANGIAVTAGGINGIIPANIFTFGTKIENCTIIAKTKTINGCVESSELTTGPLFGLKQEYERGMPPEFIYISLVMIYKKIPKRLVNGSVMAWPIYVRSNLTYPPEHYYSWNYGG